MSGNNHDIALRTFRSLFTPLALIVWKKTLLVLVLTKSRSIIRVVTVSSSQQLCSISLKKVVIVFIVSIIV